MHCFLCSLNGKQQFGKHVKAAVNQVVALGMVSDVYMV